MGGTVRISGSVEFIVVHPASLSSRLPLQYITSRFGKLIDRESSWKRRSLLLFTVHCYLHTMRRQENV